MTPYELTNNQRKYLGLSLVSDDWDKVQLSETISVYYQGDKVVKILNYNLGYFERDTDIETKQRQILLPKRIKGKEQKLTIAKILKIKGSGIQFSGSFQGGGIHVYDNKRNLFFIKSFSEDGAIKNYGDIEKWITSYISKTSTNYFDWLNNELSQKRLRVKIKEGDIVAFKIIHGQYGFARILFDIFTQRRKGDIVSKAEEDKIKKGISCCIITYGMGVYWAKATAKKFPGQIEIIDLRTLFPLDEKLIFSTVKKHGKCLVLTEEQQNNSFAEALAGRISKECFQSLDAPVEVLGALNLPAVPLNINLENAMLPNEIKVEKIITELLNY